MDSKKNTKKSRKLNYQFKLFLPIALTLWVLIIGFTIIQQRRENEYRSNVLRSRIDFINKRVLDLYEQSDSLTLRSYLSFIDKYFENSVLDGLSLTIYNASDGSILNRIGFPTPPPQGLNSHEGVVSGSYIENNNNDSIYKFNPNDAFYYTSTTSRDGDVIVQTFLPNDAKVTKELHDNVWWWVFLACSFGLVTAVIYFTTAHLARNVRLLRNFAESAAEDRDFVTIDKFPNDELGDISRQVVSIYNTRKAAIASKELEHRIAIKATEDRSLLRRQLTNNINHELKTPAGIVKGYLETIIMNPEMDEESKQHFISKSYDHINRLCNILADISTMTRLEEGGGNISLEKVNFRDFVESLALELTESHILGDMEFFIDVPNDCIVKANNALLTGALSNLAKNAALYSHGTAMGVKLFTENRRFYTFVFWDNGTGVGAEHLPMLFERFYRVDKGRSRRNGGTGLGLPIVRSSLNTMGGTISVKNRDEGGLEFIFTLNRWRPSTDTPDTPLD